MDDGAPPAKPFTGSYHRECRRCGQIFAVHAHQPPHAAAAGLAGKYCEGFLASSEATTRRHTLTRFNAAQRRALALLAEATDWIAPGRFSDPKYLTYAMLARLGYAEFRWNVIVGAASRAGAKVRLYRITAAGRELLAAWSTEESGTSR